ncbi:MAG: methyltransferase domain-containing protein [Chloroflexota bacterium]|nr:methyltransferase domain-containing protein [Chloroflexota bacterium]
MTVVRTVDEGKLDELVGKAIVDFGAIFHAALVVVGDKLGLYKALAEADPLTPGELAERTDTAERYVREWLNAQAAGGYVEYHPESSRYSLSPEQAMLLADESSPVFFIGAFRSAAAAVKIEPKLTEAFGTGEGIGWHEHDHDLYHGTERFYRSGYMTNLVSRWIPALDGVEAKLQAGAHVADIGCGHGASTILMARAYPNSTFFGFDYHEESIRVARQRAESAGVAGLVHFEVATAKEYPGEDYDFVTTFDALHDLGDPVGAAAHVLATLKENGTWMIVEPYAGDRVEDNLNPIGRAFYGASTLLCTPNSLSQEVGLALGAQAGESRLREVVVHAGFTHFRRAAQTPFNFILEARP